MAGYNFADQYRAAGLSPGPEIIRLRQEVFDELKTELDTAQIFDLTRLYFGFPLSSDRTWFRDAFFASDPSFSLIDNEREAAVLAVCLLSAALSEGATAAGLAPLTTAACGARAPYLSVDFLEHARQTLASDAVNARVRTGVELSKVGVFPKSKATAAIDAITAAPDIAKVGDLVKSVSGESFELGKLLAKQITATFQPLVQQVSELREEVDMLWWYVGGWSRALERPFSELSVGLGALMAGIDLSNIAKTLIGPVAAPAILLRLISINQKELTTPVALHRTIAECPLEAFPALDIPSNVINYPEIFPVLTALKKRADLEGSDTWKVAFDKLSGLSSEIEFLPHGLAVQVYQEAQLASQLSGL